MDRVQLRPLRLPVTLAAVLAVLATVLVAAPAAQAAPPGLGQPASTELQARAGGGFIAESGVRVLDARISVEGAATQQVSPPQSFCYVGVTWPIIHADQRATATWFLDCRSLANPNLPAPDIAGASMQVRIFQGEFNPFEPGQMVVGTECLSIQRTNPQCSTTTPGPLQFGVAYYSRLDVTVTLTGGAQPTGSFITPSIRLT
jgi:hypothetical protein